MSHQEKKSPASVAALNRTYENVTLRNACLLLIAWESFYSNAEELYYAGGEVTAIISSAQKIMERASKPEAHIGRTNTGQQLTGFTENGLLSEEDARWLHYVAKLLARERALKIDPLLEVARCVLVMHLAEGGFRGQ